MVAVISPKLSEWNNFSQFSADETGCQNADERAPSNENINENVVDSAKQEITFYLQRLQDSYFTLPLTLLTVKCSWPVYVENETYKVGDLSTVTLNLIDQILFFISATK